MLWFKDKKNSVQTKSNCQIKNNSFYDLLYNSGFYDLAAYQAVDYYVKTAPLYTGVDMIASEVASITPLVFNSETKEYITDHPVLSLLKEPNNDNSYFELIKAAVSFLMITGESYFVSTGLPNNSPKELFVIPPQSININVSSNGYISNINYSTFSGQYISFSLQSDNDILVSSSRDRYLTSNGTQEIWQIKTFNPKISSYQIRGLSPFTPLFYSIEQYIKSDIHNLAILKQGGRLSGAFIFQNELTEENYSRLKDQINANFSGAENAGRIALFSGDKVEYKELGLSLKDMDFVALKNNVETAIYNLLRIPLPLVKAEQMTLANMGIAKLNLYHNAVLPLTKRIFEELSLMLLYRYENSENLSITFRQQDIPALQAGIIEQLSQLSTLNILTINEMRSIVGYESITGGDSIYRQASDIPVAEK